MASALRPVRRLRRQRFRVDNEGAKLQGTWVDPAGGKVTFAAQAERWFATTAALKPTTRRDYRSLLDNHALPRFGDWPLARIDTLAVREWKAAMVEGGLGGKRAGKAMQVLSLVLGSAVESGRLARNPAAGVKPPKIQRREMLFLDATQVEALAEAIDPRWRVLVLLSAYSGLRPCEVVALKVGRLDLLRGTVRVPEALRWYDLRHTAASLLIREGASIKAVQRQMGHATAAITLDTYGHLFSDELPDLAERLERLRSRAVAERWPQRGPEVVSIRNSASQ